jgi:WD40 repeat protein
LEARTAPFAAIAISADGKLLAASSGFGQPVRCWDLEHSTNSVLAREGRVVSFSPDGNTLAVVAGPMQVELWDIGLRAVRRVLTSDSPLGPVATFSPDGHLLAAVSDPFEPEQAIWIWETKEGKALGKCIGHKQGIASLAFSEDGKTLASASHDNTLRLWNTATQQELLSWAQIGIGGAGLLFSPDGQLLVAGQSGKERGLRSFDGKR